LARQVVGTLIELAVASTIIIIVTLAVMPRFVNLVDEAHRVILTSYFISFKASVQLAKSRCEDQRKMGPRIQVPDNPVIVKPGYAVPVKADCYPDTRPGLYKMLVKSPPRSSLQEIVGNGKRITFTTPTNQFSVSLDNHQIFYYLTDTNCYFRYTAKENEAEFIEPKENCQSAKVCLGDNC